MCEPFDLWRIEAMPADLIDEPLDYILEDHHRQRRAADILCMIADGEFDRCGVSALVKFLEEDFARHVADEELAFFPLLRVQCIREDGIDALIAQLAEEHKQDESMVDEVICLLKKRLGGASVTARDSARIRNFAEHVRQHIALENAILLPIARVRLDDAALRIISDVLKDRRASSKRSG